ncbi:endopeptidase La [Candidatus Parcubacteria bacterium]|nr:MAG: endopeptidase La [Candidatus Parcubacteria bacterium]
MVDKNVYPSLISKQKVVFPSEKLSLVIAGKEEAKAIKRGVEDNGEAVLLFQLDSEKSRIGMVVKLSQHWELAPNVLGLIIEGVKRVSVVEEYVEDEVKMVKIEEVPPVEIKEEREEVELEALARNAMSQFKQLIQLEETIPIAIIEDLQKESLSPERVSDIIPSVLDLDFKDELKILETLDLRERLEIITKRLGYEMQVAQAEKGIQEKMIKEVEQAQKEIILRERLKAIEKELGIYEEQKEYDVLEQELMQAALLPDVQTKVMAELQRLRRMSSISPEASYIRTYLGWVADLPWNKKDETSVDLTRAKKILDEDHYGLEKAKERILEYLAVQKLTKGKGRGTILVFVGPPGTGKTSVGQSIARSLGRKFVRISLGGIRDEAEIRGHRRTYVGALPGRIIQGIKDAGSKNPVFMMDEIDKIGADFRGDPAAALLEVLDPAQNHSFSDHYIEIPFDLSEVIFITTANILDPIPPALKDRMEVIEFPGYTEDEKFHIAKKFLLPRVLEGNGLTEKQLKIEDEAISKIINRYTYEAGVRELERKLSEIVRKMALSFARDGGEMKKTVVITAEDLSKYLGPEEYDVTMGREEDVVGVATGLAWTPAGGEVIFIEANLVPGKGNLTLTGQMGDVMQESARAALFYIRGRSEKLRLLKNFYYKSDIHIHVPSGAIPKDGPSSGIAIATALASLMIRKKVRKDVALTGEVTLSGKVLRVGGVKEKVLAAHRGGVKTVVLPEDNRRNLADVPEEIKNDLDFKFIRSIDEAFDIALVRSKF